MNARNSFRPLTLASVIAAVFAATTLAACDRGQQQDRPAGQKPDSTMSRAQQKMDSAKNEMSQGAAEAKRDMKDATTDAKNVVNDATITASVNAKLASDKELSALRINVDTVDGRVALREMPRVRRHRRGVEGKRREVHRGVVGAKYPSFVRAVTFGRAARTTMRRHAPSRRGFFGV